MISSIVVAIFNVLLTFIFASSTACAILMYRVKKLPGFLAIMAIFLSYIVDNAIVFCTEMIPAFADIYDRMFLETPSIKTVCFIVRISCMLYLLSRTMPKFSMTAVLVLSIVHAFTLICVPLIASPDWMVYLYYFSSQITIICVCIWALIQLRSIKDPESSKTDTRFRFVLLYFLIMTAFVLIEDTYVIFFVDVYTNKGLSIFNRNISENLLFVGFSLGFCAYTWKRIDELLARTALLEEKCPVEPTRIIDPVSAFVDEFSLTDRENEILRCLLEGKSHQEISQSLMIALGTVKTHTHNIYAKADVANRNQIIAKYEAFLSSMEVI